MAGGAPGHIPPAPEPNAITIDDAVMAQSDHLMVGFLSEGTALPTMLSSTMHDVVDPSLGGPAPKIHSSLSDIFRPFSRYVSVFPICRVMLVGGFEFEYSKFGLDHG